MGGDELEQIADNYEGVVFEGKRYSSSEGADVGKANNVLKQFNVTDFRIVGRGDLSLDGWHELTGVPKGENIPITFKSFITGSIQHGLPTMLEIQAGNQTVIVKSKGSLVNAEDRSVNTIEELMARNLGLKIFNVEDGAMRIIKNLKTNGQIKGDQVTPELIMNAMVQSFVNEGVVPASEGGV